MTTSQQRASLCWKFCNEVIPGTVIFSSEKYGIKFSHQWKNPYSSLIALVKKPNNAYLTAILWVYLSTYNSEHISNERIGFINLSTVIRATKSPNSSRNIAAKQVEKRCCEFFQQCTKLSRVKIICCNLKTRLLHKLEDRSTFCNKTSRYCAYYYHGSNCLAARWLCEQSPGRVTQWKVWINSTATT